MSASFGAVRVLHDVHLEVPPGSLTAVLGPSGCGKTTLLRIIAGFLRPDTGSVALDGHPVLGLPPERRRIGYVSQEGSLFPHLSVADNVGFGLPRRLRRTRRRVGELLELVGLGPDLADRAPHQLSGGQQQRVALARALAPEPRVVLLDEPFAALDASLRETTRHGVVSALATAGTTALLVTHDQAEALSVAGQVAVMREGRVVQVAPPAELYRRPADAAVAGFVGDAVLLPATVRAGRAESALGPLPVAGRPEDGPATVLVRPEQLVLRPATDGGATGEPIARVVATTFYGHDATVRLRLHHEADSNGHALPTVLARTPGHAAPAVGSDVRVEVDGNVTTVDGH
ncbi:ABC transporter ATP-binding protein [Actinomycetospora sp. TBRC 11914]|nr:ABC transporter ATP-binding protein [Actinomycetospora sp. TBRC 11914]